MRVKQWYECSSLTSNLCPNGYLISPGMLERFANRLRSPPGTSVPCVRPHGNVLVGGISQVIRRFVTSSTGEGVVLWEGERGSWSVPNQGDRRVGFVQG